jgi:hypothetical protein
MNRESFESLERSPADGPAHVHIAHAFFASADPNVKAFKNDFPLVVMLMTGGIASVWLQDTIAA